MRAVLRRRLQALRDGQKVAGIEVGDQRARKVVTDALTGRVAVGPPEQQIGDVEVAPDRVDRRLDPFRPQRQRLFQCLDQHPELGANAQRQHARQAGISDPGNRRAVAGRGRSEELVARAQVAAVRAHGVVVDIVQQQRVVCGVARPAQAGADADDRRRGLDTANRNRELLLRLGIEARELARRHGVELGKVDGVEHLDLVKVDIGEPGACKLHHLAVTDRAGEVDVEPVGEYRQFVDVSHQRRAPRF